MSQLPSPAKRLAACEEYYFSRKLSYIAQLRTEGRSILNLGIGNPDLPPPSEVISALTDAAAHPDHHGYQSYRGIPELREAIVGWMKKNLDVSLNHESEVLPLMGSKEGIMHITLAFTNPGHEVLVPNPGYPTYTSVSELHGVKVNHYNYRDDGHGIDMNALAEMDLSKVSILWLNEPNMPTGYRSSNADWEELLRLASENDFLIVNDNPYGQILNQDNRSLLAMPGAETRVLELHSLSKSYNMAGWRVGWMAGHEWLLNQVLKVKSNMDSGMFLPVQKAAIKALSLPASWYEQQDAIYASRRKRIGSFFDMLNIRYAAEAPGLFVWGRVPEKWENGEALSDALLEEVGVFFPPGIVFGSGGNHFVRASLCADDEMLNEAAIRIQRFSEKHNA